MMSESLTGKNSETKMFVWLRPAVQENSPCAADPCALSASHESIFALFSRFFNKSPMVWPKWFLKKCSEPEYVSRTPENSGSKCWRSSFLRDTVSGSDESADVCDYDQNVPLVTLPTEEHVWWHIGNSTWVKIWKTLYCMPILSKLNPKKRI